MPHSTVGEARDASDLSLTGLQQELVEAVVATGTPTVVVVIGGRVFALPWIAANVPALCSWPGCPARRAATPSPTCCVGVTNPSGRLPVTLPASVGQVPVHAGHRFGGGRSQFWGDYTDGPTSPLFPFGHGLSYTTFGYDSSDTTRLDRDATEVDVTITNTGDRAGEEVVQLYVTDEVGVGRAVPPAAHRVRASRARTGRARRP